MHACTHTNIHTFTCHTRTHTHVPHANARSFVKLDCVVNNHLKPPEILGLSLCEVLRAEQHVEQTDELHTKIAFGEQVPKIIRVLRAHSVKLGFWCRSYLNPIANTPAPRQDESFTKTATSRSPCEQCTLNSIRSNSGDIFVCTTIKCENRSIDL